MKSPAETLLEAVSFAARAHRHQVRKDKETPYAAHVFRVCLVLRQVFGIDDPKTLTAALLHDAIEDTPTDYDDVADKFGDGVAGWVATLTKDMRLPDPAREPAYFAAVAAADWQVQAIKLADLYDNLCDSAHLPHAGRARSARRATEFLEYIRPHLKAEALARLPLVEAKLNEVQSQL
jgi:guanosine-3',5'-bis(diphosphate) 3'-pyrophosphohydrolase